MSNEFDLIARVRARVEAGESDPAVLVGIGDDAAVVRPEPGLALVATTDTLVAERHFRSDWTAQEIGHLALAVNLSDLAAMGATPRWALLSLTLPEAEEAWVDAFLTGFLGLAEASGTGLIGGNIAAGPLNLGVTLIGQVNPARVLTRVGARPGHSLLVTGTLGDAAGALSLGKAAPEALGRRLRRPQPRLAAGAALAGHAASMIDVSDGLLADLGHLLGEGLGAELDLAALPTGRALRTAFPRAEARWQLQLAGGNDYELLWTVAAERLDACREALAAVDVETTVIGQVTARSGIICRRPEGGTFSVDRNGWDHFGH